MFEQRQQGNRREAAERSFGGQARENSCRRVGQSVAAGILGGNVPAFERGQHATPERAIRRHESRRLAGVDGFAQRHCDGERFIFGIGRFDDT